MTVRYLHIRVVDDDDEILPNGGLSIAYTDLGNKELMFQIALCNESDNFDYRIGRAISLGRLQSNKHTPYIIPFSEPVSKPLIEWVEGVLFGGDVQVRQNEKGRWIYNPYTTDRGIDVPEISADTNEDVFQTQLKAEVPPQTL